MSKDQSGVAHQASGSPPGKALLFKSQLQSHLLGEGVPVQTCLFGLTVPSSYFCDSAYPVLGLKENNKLYPCPLILESIEKDT